MQFQEFLAIFLVAAKANGISYFKDLGELNQKESPRLEWAKIILEKMGVKTITTKNSIKIYGNPDLKVKKKISYWKSPNSLNKNSSSFKNQF